MIINIGEGGIVTDVVPQTERSYKPLDYDQYSRERHDSLHIGSENVNHHTNKNYSKTSLEDSPAEILNPFGSHHHEQ